MDTMSPQTGYYCLIQYCPDPSRAEAVNVGVLLFCPALRFLEARMTQNNKRVLRLFGPHAVDRVLLDFGKRSICNRLRVEADRFLDVADLEHFVNTRANDWRLTPPRSMRVTDPVAQLEGLFRELVAEKAKPAPAATLTQRLRELMERPTLRGRVRRQVRVTLPNTSKEVIVPYAYRNGTVNLVQPQEFASDPKRVVNVALRLACEGELLQKYRDPDGRDRRFIVITNLPTGADQRHEVEAIFGEYRIRTVGPEAVEAFVDEVEREAHA